MGAIALVVGLIGFGTMIAAVTVFAVTRSRRNSRNVGPATGTYPQNMGYPPPQPMYPSATSGQSYPAPPGQAPPQPNPYQQ